MNELEPMQIDILKILRGVDFSSELAERDRAHRAEVRRILLNFLEVLDALDRALGQDEPTGTLTVVRKQLLAAFERVGVRFMNTAGQPFDPQCHRALEVHPESGDHPIIVEEITRGCEWNGELLRPAGVVIGRLS